MVLSNELIIQFRHRKGCRFERSPFAIQFDEELTLKTSVVETLYKGEIAVSTRLMKTNYLMLREDMRRSNTITKNTKYHSQKSVFSYIFSYYWV